MTFTGFNNRELAIKFEKYLVASQLGDLGKN